MSEEDGKFLTRSDNWSNLYIIYNIIIAHFIIYHILYIVYQLGQDLILA